MYIAGKYQKGRLCDSTPAPFDQQQLVVVIVVVIVA